MQQKFVFSGREWQALVSGEKLEWVFPIAVSLEVHNYGHGFLMYIRSIYILRENKQHSFPHLEHYT